MGCAGSKKIIHNQQLVQERNKYLIKVVLPDKPSLEFKHESEYEKLPLTAIMNYILFDHTQSSLFNGSFISKYSLRLKRFQYFIQRLASVDIENEEKPYEGRQWVAYINETKSEWDTICESEVNVRSSDSIRFEYEALVKG